MSMISKDSIIQACADAYKQGVGASSVKVGELAEKILKNLSSEGLPEGIEIGEFTPIGGTGNFTVKHGLGVKPRYVFGWMISTNAGSGTVICRSFSKINIEDYSINEVVYSSSSGELVSETTTASVEDDANLFCVPKMPGTVGMIPIYAYKYIAIA